MKKYTENAQDYFDRHPQNDECHITSDGRVFHTLGSAQGFAGTLDDQIIESYKRAVLEKESKTENDDDAEKSKAEVLAMEVFLKNNEVEKLKYEDLKKLTKIFDLKPADQKAETLIAALIEYKNSLNS